MKIKDRIVELRRVPAIQLAPNPKNGGCSHLINITPCGGILSEIGISAAAIAVERPEGLVLIDGHLRTEILQDELIPVLNVDLTDAEADLLLTTFDSVKSLADTDPDKLDQLLSEVSTQSVAVQAMLDKMSVDHGISSPDFQPSDNGSQGVWDHKKPIKCPYFGEKCIVRTSLVSIFAIERGSRTGDCKCCIPKEPDGPCRDRPALSLSTANYPAIETEPASASRFWANSTNFRTRSQP